MKAPLTFLPRFQKIQKMARRKWMFLYSCKKRLLCWIWRSVNLIRMVRIYCQWWLPKSILLISFSDSVMFFWLENLEEFKKKSGTVRLDVYNTYWESYHVCIGCCMNTTSCGVLLEVYKVGIITVWDQRALKSPRPGHLRETIMVLSQAIFFAAVQENL